MPIYTAYDADHLRIAITAAGATAVIPNNPSRASKLPFDKILYKERQLVGRWIGKLKQFGRIAPDTRRPPETISLSSPSPLPSCGSGKRPHGL